MAKWTPEEDAVLRQVYPVSGAAGVAAALPGRTVLSVKARVHRLAIEHPRFQVTFEQRFWRKVNKDGSVHPSLGTPCWLWTSRVVHGYGKIAVVNHRGPHLYAHRVAWELTHGPMPTGDGYHGTCVCHRCDNRLCVNPDHLFLGTHADNMADMRAKGRSGGRRRRGELSPLAKLTNAQANQIRELLRTGVSQREAARRFGVSRGTVVNIGRGRTYSVPSDLGPHGFAAREVRLLRPWRGEEV